MTSVNQVWNGVDGYTYHVIAHGDKQIKEQQSTLFHFHLHGATPLEGIPAPNDQSEVVRS